jgi:Flp pilus assembly secretin CpaC
VLSTIAGTVEASVSGQGLSIQINNTAVAGGTAGFVTVVGNPGNLAAQTYLGVLSVTVGAYTQEEEVSFQVTGSGSIILSQSSIPWTYTTGGNAPAPAAVTVTSASGAGSYTATASSAGDWLLVNGSTQAAGVLPATLAITPGSGLTQLSTGTYTGTILITTSDGSLAYLNVNLTVNGGAATGLTVSPNPISLSAPVGGTAVQQTIGVTSVDGGTLSATVTGTGLSLQLPSDTTVTPNQVFTFTLIANPAGLSAQSYIGSLSVTVGAVTQSVQVSFSVGAVNSGTNGTTTYSPIPSFNFEDLGLTIKVTPTVHSMEETSLDIDAEFKVLAGQAVNGVPIISNRTMKSRARVLNGEWAVVGGLLNTQEARNIAGLAGVARIRGLGALVSTREHDFSKNEVIVLIRPVILTPPNQTPPRKYATGTDTKPVTPF